VAASSLENLRVMRTAEELADIVWRSVGGWNAFEKQALGAQLVRAADSVGANIAEGAGRGSYADNRRFVTIARGSLYETRYLLRLAERRGLLSGEDKVALKPLRATFPRSLNAYRRSIGTKARRDSTTTGNDQ
jgi:four helix bundle protein